MTCVAYENPIDKSLKPNLDISPESRARPELHIRAAPSVEAHHCPDTGRNSGGRRIIKKTRSKLTPNSHHSIFTVNLKPKGVFINDVMLIWTIFDPPWAHFVTN